ncbi:serine hydrolase [Robertkochia sediminum]|uniref:serine hydrolase n=1 Tax=Robertkochia sediminum TaxID=2785326 RepID=UPI0019332F9E|nr:serine hydrolase [Robertkochia sediminum]MBL7472016.1 serine hydrolase [Robertkochia sediminum]
MGYIHYRIYRAGIPLFLNLLLLLPMAVLGQEKEQFPVFITDSLEQYIVTGMAEWKIPGLSVAIIKNNNVVLSKGYGVTRAHDTVPVDENTLFMIGSLTKQFTATALSMIAESSSFSLTDKVQRWLPEFRLKDPYASKEANIIDLLSHRLGFDAFQGSFVHWTSRLTRAEIIESMSRIAAPNDFRSSWGYSNAAYVAAGELIPKVTGRTWREVVRDSILKPLKMHRTLTLSATLSGNSNVARPHALVNNELVEVPVNQIDNIAASGSMSSTVKDLSNWLYAQLNNGWLLGEPILPIRSVGAIRQPHNLVDLDERMGRRTRFNLYGLGLFIRDVHGKLEYYHDGSVEGYTAVLSYIPEEQLGVVILTNTNNFFAQSLLNKIQDTYLGINPEDYTVKSAIGRGSVNTVRDQRIDSLRAIDNRLVPKLPTKAIIGNYSNTAYGQIAIRRQQNDLILHFSEHPDLIGKLEHLHDATYLCTFSNPLFGRSEVPFYVLNNKVLGFDFKVDPRIEYSEYEFIKTR